MSTESAPLSILGVGLWLPGFASAQAWRDGTPDPAATKPLGLAFDRVNRRRASQLGRALADAGAQALAEAAVDPATVPTVIGSSIGEASTMIGLLDQMWRQCVPMSPAGFTMSVHNSASGLISITNGNRGFSTSIAADDDTPAGALLEAAGLVHAFGVPVVIACADETPPPDLVPAEASYELLAAAVVVAPAGHPGPVRSRLRLALGGGGVLDRGLHQADEHRLRAQGAAGQLGVGLRANEVRVHVLRQLEDLHDRLRRVLAAEDQPVLFEDRDELGVDLVTVTEAQAD